MPLEYADVDIISKIAAKARSIGLAVNESKTMYLLSSTDKASSIEESVEIGGYNFEVVKHFVYLGSSINTDNDISLQIRRRSTLANRCCFGLRKQLGKRVVVHIAGLIIWCRDLDDDIFR